MAIDFIKREDGEFAKQLQDFSVGLGIHGTALGFTTAEKAEAIADAAWANYVLGQQKVTQAFSQAYTRFKVSVRHGSETALTEPTLSIPAVIPTPVNPDVESRFRLKAAKAKSSSLYTKAIGEVLNIVAPENTVPLGLPVFQITLVAGHAVISWTKGGADGVEIWKDDGKGIWQRLDRDNQSPYLDKSPLPPAGQSAVWKYKLIYVVNDEVVGDFSPDTSVTVRGLV